MPLTATSTSTTPATTDRATGNDVDSKGASGARFKNHADIVGLQYTYKFK